MGDCVTTENKALEDILVLTNVHIVNKDDTSGTSATWNFIWKMQTI